MLDGAASQSLGGLDEDRIIQGYERLQRRVRAVAAQRADFAVRGVECGHRGIRIAPSPCGVHGAAMAIVAVTSLPVGRAAEGRVETKTWLGRPHWRSIHLFAQKTTGSQGLVADHFGA